MKTFQKRSMMLVVLAMMVALLAACGGDKEAENGEGSPEEQEQERVINTDPVELVFFNAGGFPENRHEAEIYGPLREMYPHITLRHVMAGPGSQIQDLITAGNIPDVMFFNLQNTAAFQDAEVLRDLTDLARAHGFNLDGFQDGLLDTVRNYSWKGELMAFPWTINPYAMYYNKDIFDRFGVDYPTDLMTWDEVMDLSRQIGREEDGVAYRGFDMTSRQFLARLNQYSVTHLNEETNRASVNNDQWRLIFNMFRELYAMPGNSIAGVPNTANAHFIQERRVGMLVSTNLFGPLQAEEQAGNPMNWDIVTVPHLRGHEPHSFQPLLTAWAISSTTQHPDQAFLVLEAMSSVNAHTIGMRVPRFTTLKDPAVHAALGEGNEFIQSRNLDALFKLPTALTPPLSKYEAQTFGILQQEFFEVIEQKKDVNTALRDLEERLNTRVDQLEAQ